MRFNKDENIEDLTEFGFFHINDIKDDLDELDFLYYLEDCYLYNLGHARRGQYYYLIVDEKSKIDIYASEADGSGSSVLFDDIILKLYDLNYFVKDEDSKENTQESKE